MSSPASLAAESERLRALKLARCSDDALAAGLWAGASALATAGAGVAAAVFLSPGFRRATGVSSRTALAVSPAFFLFFLRSEQSLSRCARGKTAAGAAASPSS